MAGERSQSRFAITLITIGLLAALLSTVFILILPENVVATLDRVPIKFTLFLCSYVLLAWIGILIYRIYYLQSSKRLIQTTFYGILILGGTITVTSTGLVAIQSMELMWTAEQKFNVIFSPPHEGSPILALAVTAAALLCTCWLHVWVSREEALREA